MAKGKTAEEAFDDKPKTIKDPKRGTAANDHEVPINGTGDNSFAPVGSTIDEYLALVVEKEGENDGIKEQMRLKNEPFKKKIKDNKQIITNARERLVKDGYDTTALGIITKQYMLRREADQATKELDDNQKKRFAAMQKAWTDFRSTPLGAATEERETAPALN